MFMIYNIDKTKDITTMFKTCNHVSIYLLNLNFKNLFMQTKKADLFLEVLLGIHEHLAFLLHF